MIWIYHKDTNKRLLQNVGSSNNYKHKWTGEKFNSPKRLPFVKLTLKFPSPDRLPTSAISQWVSCLYHETLDDIVEDKIIMVAIPAVCR